MTGAGSSLPCSVLAEGCGDAEVLDSVEEDGADVAALESELAAKLGARVAIRHGRNGRGKLVIQYHSLDELDGILEKIR